MTKLYTGGGDKACTDTQKDRNIPKNSSIIELIGELDEFTSCLGVAKAHSEDEGLRCDIEMLQKKLMAVMDEVSGGSSCTTCKCVSELEGLTDSYGAEFEGFSVPGKNKVSAFLDLARCVARRAERTAAGLFLENSLNENVYCWLNRVSDLVYAMSRYAEK